jgi:signal peptidase I
VKLSENMGPNSATLKRDMACEILLSSGSMQLRARGCSMFPIVRPGDVLMIERARIEQVRVGDVVVTADDSGFASHRVVEIGTDDKGTWLITCGDAANVSDLPVREGDLLGRARCLSRKGRLVHVHSHLKLIDRMAAKIFCHSFPAVRALIEVRGRWQNGFRTSKESIAPCQS